MYKIKPEIYIGKQYTNGFTGQFAVGDYFGILSFEDGISQDHGKQLLEKFKEKLQESDSENLETFEEVVANLIVKLNLPLHADIAIGFVKDSILYLKTVGKAQIFVLRNGVCKLLLKGNKVASGVLKEKDVFILTNHVVEAVIGQEADIQTFVDNLSTNDIIQKISDEIYSEEDLGFVFFLAEFVNKTDQQEEFETTVSEIENIKTAQVEDGAKNYEKTEGISFKNIVKDKRFVVGALILLVVILSWSVFFGYQRRQAEAVAKKIESVRQEIYSKLEEATERSDSAPDEAVLLIQESKNAFNTLVRELGNDIGSAEVKKLEEEITNKEKQISKKNTADLQEFYDLTLEKKDARGSALDIENNSIAVLDNNLSTVYVLDLEKKSLRQFVSPELKNATLVALFRDEVYFFIQEEGIYKFTAQNKIRLIIEVDEEWGEISAFKIYNGNIYLLDSLKKDVYRYLVAEGGYSSKKSYFTNANIFKNADNVLDIDIDGAIYVLLSDRIEKYLSGKKESFETKFSTKNISLSKLSIGQTTDDFICALDVKNNTVYKISKDGVFESALESNIFDDNALIFQYDNKIYVLQGSKIYSLE